MFSLLVACSEYVVDGKENTQGGETVDESRPVEDSGDPKESDPVDSGGEVIDPPEDSDPTVATESIYVHTSTTLFSYDPATNAAVRIGDFKEGGSRISDMTDIAIDMSGHRWGGAFTRLYEIDPRSGACTYVRDLPDSATGLTFLSDGRLVIAGSALRFFDPATNQTSVLVGGGTYTTSGDIVGLPDGYLYWTVTSWSGGDGLVRVDPNSGTTTYVGDLSASSLYGVGYANGTLYGFSSWGTIVGIDPSNARNISTNTVNQTWWGATTNPVRW